MVDQIKLTIKRSWLSHVVPYFSFFLLISLWVPSVVAMRAVFFQPQISDMKIQEDQWPRIFAAARAQGFDTLIIQWSEYGSVFSQGNEQTWLASRVQDVLNADLKIVLGLYADPDMFAHADSPDELMRDYLLSYLKSNRRLAEYWTKHVAKDALVGWYLPLEIDDRRWRDPKAQDILAEYLSREFKSLHAVKDIPVYVSSFFRANMSPTGYKEMIGRLNRDSGVRIWVQDGRGTSPLTSNEIGLYLKTLADCRQPVVSGVVYELFQQTGPDTSFKAQALPLPQRESALKQTAPCGLDTVVFSLRYVVDFR